MSNIYGKIVDSMQKVFPAAEPTGEEYGKTILQNERLNFQLAYKNDTATTIALAEINVEGDLAPFVTIRSAELVPAQAVESVLCERGKSARLCGGRLYAYVCAAFAGWRRAFAA